MVSKQATRPENKKGSKGLSEYQTLHLAVPKPLLVFFKAEFGKELLERLKERKQLSSCEFDEEEESIALAGQKEHLEASTKFLKFNFDNLLQVDKLKELKSELTSK